MCKIKLVFVMIPTAINQGKQLIETTRTLFFLYEFLVKTPAEEMMLLHEHILPVD